MYNKLCDMISGLAQMRAVSTDEAGLSHRLCGLLKDLCDEAYIDRSGNAVGIIYAETKTDKTLMLEAHMDSIGLMVSEIDEEGFIKFVNIGGLDERVLLSEEVIVCGREEIKGVIFSISSDENKNPKLEELRIDTGYSKSEAEKRISAGDMILIKPEVVKLYGSRMACAAMDDRAGIAAVLCAVQRLDRKKLTQNIAVLFAVEEELGLHGAHSGTELLKPDAALVVDVTHGITPDSKNERGVFALGSGAVICRGPNFDYELTKKLISLAKAEKIQYDIEVAPGASGTDTWATQICGGGVFTMLVSIPLRYMHSNVETLDISDVYAVSRLIKAAAEGGLLND